MPASAHAFPAPLTHQPFPSFRSRMLRKHHAKEALERVVGKLPIERIVQPTDKCVYVCWFGCDIVQPPISTITDVARAVDKNLLQLLVECHLRVGRVSIVLRSHFRIRRQNSLALAHISPGMIGSPGAIGMQRQQVDRHGGSMTQRSAGYHPQLFRSSAICVAQRAIAAGGNPRIFYAAGSLRFAPATIVAVMRLTASFAASSIAAVIEPSPAASVPAMSKAVP